MQILVESEHEAATLEARFRALAACLGPTVELIALLPDGRVLQRRPCGNSLAAQCASLNERIEDSLRRRRDQSSRGSR